MYIYNVDTFCEISCMCYFYVYIQIIITIWYATKYIFSMNDCCKMK